MGKAARLKRERAGEVKAANVPTTTYKPARERQRDRVRSREAQAAGTVMAMSMASAFWEARRPRW